MPRRLAKTCLGCRSLLTGKEFKEFQGRQSGPRDGPNRDRDDAFQFDWPTNGGIRPTEFEQELGNRVQTKMLANQLISI